MEYRFEVVNFEITKFCPFKCPQCYCSLQQGKNMDIEVAKYWIEKAFEYGIKGISLSGGETFCYPYLFDVIRYIHRFNLAVYVVFSGWGFDDNFVKKLLDSAVSGIYISLNGSKKEINEITREGYGNAIRALELLKKYGSDKTVLNWVMHRSNADDFYNMIRLAEYYDVKTIDILSFKPVSKEQIVSMPTKEQLQSIVEIIKQNRSKVKIRVESCFTQLLVLLKDTKMLGNLNIGKNKGCRAGKYLCSVNYDGTLSPCRHINYSEVYEDFNDYMQKSNIIAKIQKNTLFENFQGKCRSCIWKENCIPCIAFDSNIYNEIRINHENCMLSNT